MNLVQLRLAQAGLGWSQERLARAADVPMRSYQGIEEERHLGINPAMTKLRKVLEEAGVEFIEADGGGAGVRMRKG